MVKFGVDQEITMRLRNAMQRLVLDSCCGLILNMISKEGDKIKAHILSQILHCDSQLAASPNVEVATQRLAHARSLKLLLNDPSQILLSQLILAEQYFHNKCYDLSVTYCLETLEKDQEVEHQLRAEYLLIKHKIHQGKNLEALEQIAALRQKQEQSQDWKEGANLEMAKLEAISYTNLEQYEKAINVLEKQMKELKNAGKQNSLAYAELRIESARNNHLNEDNWKASSQQQQAITILQIYTNQEGDRMVTLYMDLAKYQELCDCLEDESRSLAKAEQSHRQSTDTSGKTAIEIKKKICHNLKSRKMIPEALRQYQLLKNLTEERFGSFAPEMAVVKRDLGRVYETLNRKSEAMMEYSQAGNIFAHNKDNESSEKCRSVMLKLKSSKSQLRMYKNTLV